MWVVAAALAASTAACGSSAKSSAADGDSATPATEGATPTGASADSGDTAHAGSIDVCSLLSEADAGAVAKQFKLGGDSVTAYKLTAEKRPPPTTAYPSSSCRFTIATADIGSQVTFAVVVSPAKYLDKTGTKIEGLGDEAYDEGPYDEVRVGDIVLQTNENSGAGEDFLNAIYRAMIPNIT